MASLGHGLHGLLSSIRCIAQHEDAVCELLHDVQHNSHASGKIATELLSLLDDLPSRDYLDDIEAVRDILGQSRTASQRKSRTTSAAKQRARSSAKKPSRRAVIVKIGSRKATPRGTRRKPSR
jgi:hypothetical protein